MKRIIIFAMVLCLFTACAKPVVAPTASELLDLGEKYLLELNYEQALVQFLAVIEVEPMNARAYIGAAEAYVALGDKDSAIAVLEQGLEATGDAAIAAMLSDLTKPTPTPTPIPTPEPTPENRVNPLAIKLIETYKVSGYEAVIAEMRSEEFARVLSDLMSDTSTPFIFTQENDISCGFYSVGEAIYVYIGNYVDQIRSGEGAWLCANTGDSGYYVFTGAWADDMPNGYGEAINDIDVSHIERQEGYSYAIKATESGNFVNGLASSSLNLKYVLDNGDTHNWNLSVTDGIAAIIEVLDTDEHWRNVEARCTDCEATYSSGGQPHGVNGLTS